MAPDKRYTEEEARTIFKRAAERHDEARRAEEASRAGLTLEELKRIGAQAGIDPEHIAAVAAVGPTDASSRDERKTFLGIPSALRASRTLPIDVSDEGWEQIVPEMRGIFGKDGIPGQIGRIRTWQIPYDPIWQVRSDKPVTLEVSSSETGSEVEIGHDLKKTVVFGVITAVFFAIFAGIFGTVSIVAMVVSLLSGLAFFGALWAGMRMYFRNMKRRFERAFDRIELIARKSSKQDKASAREAKTRPQVDLDALPDEPVDERANPATERTRDR